MRLREALAVMLRDCGEASTGEGLVEDAKLLARVAGIEFSTLRATVDALATQFGIDLDQEDEAPAAATWEQRVIDANANASAFPEDDLFARHLLRDPKRPPPSEEAEASPKQQKIS